ncbi:MAG: EAL domain-containing response regulator [Alphaproteobacteria bacterium]
MTFDGKKGPVASDGLDRKDDEAGSITGTTVCIVDDEKFMSTYVADLVRALDCTPFTANNFEEFKAHNSDTAFDVIVLDLTMPDKDGVEYLRHLHVSGFKGTVILMSGYDLRTLETVERLGKSLDLHIAGSLAKPINQKLFAAMLKDVRPVDPETTTGNPEHYAITEDDLARAIANKEFYVVYQPIVQLQESPGSEYMKQYPSTTLSLGGLNLNVNSLEVLVRWRHPEYETVSPASFIPLAEEIGLIGKLTECVVDMVMEQVSNWQQVGFYPRVSINYSPKLITDLTIPDYLALLAEKAGISHDRLTLEITENAAMSDANKGMDILSRLRLKGVHLAIDDFGTGFSSLLQLYHLPFTELKIDMSLASEIVHKKAAAIIVEAIVRLSHELGLTVCAEGVETEEVAARLKEMGCDVAQGYLYSKPLPGNEILDSFMQSRKSSA